MTQGYGYAYQKEAKGYSVWLVSLWTGDMKDLICYARTSREAQAKVNKLYKEQTAHS